MFRTYVKGFMNDTLRSGICDDRRVFMSLEKGYLTQYEDVYDLPGRVYDTSKAVYGTIGSVMSLQKGYLTQ